MKASTLKKIAESATQITFVDYFEGVLDQKVHLYFNKETKQLNVDLNDLAMMLGYKNASLILKRISRKGRVNVKALNFE